MWLPDEALTLRLAGRILRGQSWYAIWDRDYEGSLLKTQTNRIVSEGRIQSSQAGKAMNVI